VIKNCSANVTRAEVTIKIVSKLLYFLFTAVGFISGCSNHGSTVVELKRYPVQNLDGVISKSNVAFDKQISSDGNGSIRITANKPVTILLYETGDIDAEDARLTYQAKVRTEGVEGKVYLEMLCQFPGKGEYFSRDLGSSLTGTNEWSSEETPFFLKEGGNPDNVKLNIVIDGKGTVWIDDIRLLKGPLQ
jgi:hypothetical protein